MHVTGSEDGVTEWVSSVQNLRYKDYQCVRKPAALETASIEKMSAMTRDTFEEVDEVVEFKDRMISFGLLEWWRTAMGYETSDKIGGTG